MRTRSRLLAGLACMLLLLLPCVAASAEDDPVPREWPTVQEPDTGSDSDPKPKEWPAPEQR